MMTGEHFTNFFLDGLPQIAIGLDEEHLGPPEVWLQVPKKMVPSRPRPGRAHHREPDRTGSQPALSHGMKIDHGFMTVYYWLDRRMELPMVPIVLNCTTPPLMTMRQFYDFGVDARQRDPVVRRPGAGGAGRRRRPVALRRRAAGR